MAYSKASGKAVAKYDKKHYKMVTVKIPLNMFDEMQKCSRYENNNQFVNMLILDELKREGLLPVKDNVSVEDMSDGEQ